MTEKPNVLVLLLDSLRSDRVSRFGHERETTPNLDLFGDTATVYTSAYTPTPWTLPSHCSFFTGRFPSEHGVTNAFPDSNLRLPESLSTVAELLSERGYDTGGFSNNPWVGKTSGLNRGFDDFVEWDLELTRSESEGSHDVGDRLKSRLHTLIGTASRQPLYLLKRPFFTDDLVGRAVDWIGNRGESDRPWFCFMNLMEAHSPYFPRESGFRDLGLDPSGLLEPRLLNMRLLAYVLGKTDMSESLRQRVMEYYDASIRYQDRKLGALLGLLKRTDQFSDTLIVVCSDHGKTLGEFDRDGTPPHYLRDINTRVPLFVKTPDQTTGETDDAPVELTSLFDFVLDGGQKPFTAYQPSREYALIEDHVPHTGRDSPDSVTQWRGLGYGDRKYVRSSDGEEYLFGGRLDRESVVAFDDERPYASELDDRIADLSEVTGASSEQNLENLEGSVKGQLKDLGYMK